MQRGEFLKGRSDHRDAIFNGRCQPQAAAQHRLLHARFGNRLIGFRENAQAARIKPFAGIGQSKAARGAMKECDAQFVFELLKVETDGGSGLIELLGSRCERSRFRDGSENSQAIQTHRHGTRSNWSKNTTGDV
ncbi:hypothetical protein D9M68_691480 [compost metagenome]